MQLLRPSQDAPDTSVGSVCIQGDQDTGWTDGASLLAGPGGGLGSGGVILGTRLPVEPGGISRHLFTCPAPQRSPDSTWGSRRLGVHDIDVRGQVCWTHEGCGPAHVRL